MSSSASISAAKKRRANQVQSLPLQQPQSQPMQRPISASVPGPNQSLANLTPAQRQQFLMQQQQRMQQQQQQMQQMQQQQKQQQSQPKQMQQQQQPQPQPPTRNPLSWPAPPIYLMKQMDTLLFQQSQSIDEIKNRLNCIESGSHGTGDDTGITLDDIDNIKPALMNDSEFVNGIVDNIMTNSNLSEIIEQVDTVQTENRELRELLYAQQKTINEMNIMLLKLFSQNQAYPNAVASAPIAAAVPAKNAANPELEQPQDEMQYELQDEMQDEMQDELQEEEEEDELQAQNVELEIEDK